MQIHRNRLMAILATLAMGIALFGLEARAQVNRPGAHEGSIAQNVCRMMELGHITRHRIDDEMSQRIHQQFLRMFDPFKLYFLETDIREFGAMETMHDDRAPNGDIDFEIDAYTRFIERLEERMTWVREFAGEEFDFDKEESIVVDPEAATYAKNNEESKARWRRRIKFELLTLNVDGKTTEEARERILKRYRNLAKHWRKLDSDELLEMYLTAVTTSFDPHSTYMSSRTLDDFRITMQLSLEGIGALLQDEDGSTMVKEIVPGGAADKDGRLKPGDRIVGVAEETGEIIDLVDMKLRNVVRYIRGKAGTTVRLEIIPEGAQNRVIYDLVRQKIELQDREAKGRIIESAGAEGPEKYRIGVIDLPSFYADDAALRNGDLDATTVTNDVRRILGDFKTKAVDGVIVDLRTNGGGLLSEAIELTGLFIDQGPIVQVKDYDNRVVPYDDSDGGVAYGGPLVVLVSRFSASASEIFAGAIQDYGRGIVVGDSATHGKGTVQKIISLRGDRMGALKLTMQQFYRVNGDSTQNMGVRSDIVLPSPTDHDDFGEAKLDFALEFDKIPRADFESTRQVTPDLVAALRKDSMRRLETEPELLKLVARRDRSNERRGRKTLTFSDAKLRKERAELDADERAELERQEHRRETGEKKEEKVFGSDPYTKEVLAITDDLIRLKASNLTAN